MTRITNIGKGIIVWFAIVLFSIITILNLILTGYFDEFYNEWTYFRWENVPLMVIIIGTILVLATLLYKKTSYDKLPIKILAGVLFFYAVVASIGWVLMSKSTSVADRKYVADEAMKFMQGDYSGYQTAGYLFWYPFQTGIVALLELVFNIFGTGNIKAFKIINAFCVGASFMALIKITGLMFTDEEKRKRIQRIAIILCFFCLPPIFYVTYVYGNIVGFTAAFWALYYELKYLKGKSIYNLVPAAILITAGIILKNNMLIILIAMLIFLLLHALENKRWISLAAMVAMLLIYIVGSKGFMAIYSARTGVDMPEGVPMSLYIQMGLKEGYFGCGTYDASTIQLYTDAGYNAEAAKKLGNEIIKQRLELFDNDPFYSMSFWLRKTALQWCEPTYMSIWESNCTPTCHYEPVSEFTQSIYTGGWHNFLLGLMNIYQSLIWICATVYVIINRKKMDTAKLLLVTSVIGGILFHTMWEAKSQYVIQYFCLLIPYAAAGFLAVVERCSRIGVKK